jgi:hypothetical protein
LIILILVVVAIGEMALMSWLPRAAGGASFPLRILLASGVMAPLGFLMGFPMPTALGYLARGAPALVPWAWGVNGFASVLAPPLATAIGMIWGFDVAALAGALLYTASALAISRLALLGSAGQDAGG